jgi:hypothetical protein
MHCSGPHSGQDDLFKVPGMSLIKEHYLAEGNLVRLSILSEIVSDK